MTSPARVGGFLNVFGAWDPTLAFVRGSAVLVMAVAWRIRRRMGTPIFAERFSLPDRKDLDGRLITGSILFGVGWGLAGLCPGPAVAQLALSPLRGLPDRKNVVQGKCVSGRGGRGGRRCSKRKTT